MSVDFMPVKTILRQIGSRSKQVRLKRGWTRSVLAGLCGVPESSIKRFETTGEIGTKALANIFISLDLAGQLSHLAEATAPETIADLLQPRRARGRRSDAGRPRAGSSKLPP